MGEPVFGDVTSYALKPSSIAKHGAWIQGLPFFLAGGLEIGALVTVLIALKFQAKPPMLPVKKQPNVEAPPKLGVLEMFPTK